MFVSCNSEAHRILMGVLAEQMAGELPYHFLWLAVIGQAIADAHLSVSGSAIAAQRAAEARAFLGGSGVAWVCDAIGLDAEWTREKVRRFAEQSAAERERRRQQNRRRITTRYGRPPVILELFSEAA